MTDPATERLTGITQQRDDGRYVAKLEALTHAARLMLQTADGIGGLAAMRNTLGQMEALAPVLEPTAYVRGGGMNLADQRAFLAAVDEFVTALRKLDRRPTT